MTDRNKDKKSTPSIGERKTSRREFLKLGGTAAALGVLAPHLGVKAASASLRSLGGKKRPNFLFILVDQMGLDAISSLGCLDSRTPNIDHLVRRGVSFIESHSTNPICSPARASIFTGRMPVETGVVDNDRFLHPSIPTMGQWFRDAGYDTVYSGKWHIPYGYPHSIDGFTVLPSGNGEANLIDPIVSRSCEAYLRNRRSEQPFLLVASLTQPHDICGYYNDQIVPKEYPFPQIADQLPPLPPNYNSRPPAPKKLVNHYGVCNFTETQWRFYLYAYYRQVEMVDAEIGRILEGLNDSGLAENTIIVFTSDHGDGRGRHRHVGKSYPYDEAVKVPLIVSCPGRIPEGYKDEPHLVSGLDIMSTLCDYAGIEPPPDTLGLSLKPLVEKKTIPWRESLLIEVQVVGRVIRTERYKYVKYKDDPVEQLFDLKDDPFETMNLYDNPRDAAILEDHRKILKEWEARLKPVPPTPKGPWRQPGSLRFA